MNRNCLFLVSMVCVSLLLFLLRLTGLIPHIIVSLIGLVVMILLTLQTRREWNHPAPEIILRALYLVAVVTGGILMKVSGAAALIIAHKVCAILFIALLFLLYIPKVVRK